MYHVALPPLGFAPVWRDAARRLAGHAVSPGRVSWGRGDSDSGDLFGGQPLPDGDGRIPVTAPKSFATLAENVLCHSDPEAPALLYQALHRHQGDRGALSNPADPLSRRLEQLAKSVRRDIHKMHAFLRFREIPGDGPRRHFAAWFEPDHAILEAATGFFARRFGDMDWDICTPQGIARFRAGRISLHPPAPRPDLPDDASEALWGTYFAHIFNPARIHLNAMRSEMPLKYWKNLPETRLIPEMLQGAEARVAAMRAAAPGQPPLRAARILSRQAVPDAADLPETLEQAAQAAMSCTRCDLCHAATQTVWGTGDPAAPLMIVGEAPGDAEDLAGQPFIGPAGQLLRQVMAEADPGPVWLTNAVKHFKFIPRGKRRLHQNPSRGEVVQCRWWLGLERRFIAPRLTVALGGTAAFALTGRAGEIGARRGGFDTAQDDGGPVLITWHPSHILRLGGAAQAQARAEMLADLRAARAWLAQAAAAPLSAAAASPAGSP